jgi:hypothetical protein
MSIDMGYVPGILTFKVFCNQKVPELGFGQIDIRTMAANYEFIKTIPVKIMQTVKIRQRHKCIEQLYYIRW